MTKTIKYYPNETVKKNARLNGVSEASIRLYIKNHNIDRRADEKARKIEICRKFYKSHKNTTRHNMAVETKISNTWITTYWDYITSNKPITFFDSNKSKKRKEDLAANYFKPHPSVLRDILREEELTKDLLVYLPNERYSLIFKVNGFNARQTANKKECDIVAMPSVSSNLKTLLGGFIKTCKSKVALLLPLSFLSGESRFKTIFSAFPLSKILVYIEDVNIEKIDVNDSSEKPLSVDNYAWYIFERGFEGKPSIEWIHNDTSMLFGSNYVEECTILGGIKFHPNEWFRHNVNDVVIFHNYALPENRVLANHHNCIITFRGIEFWGVEQLCMCMGYSDSPSMIRAIMNAQNCENVRTIVKDNKQNHNWDSNLRQYSVISLCHLYKYLSYKPCRDRLRELRNATLVESPNGKDYRYACVQNLETNILEGQNCSGRTTTLVRDMMLALEDKALDEAALKKGTELTEEERESCIQAVCDKVRNKFDNDEEVIELSQKFIDVIEKYNIPKVKKKRPKPFEKVVIDSSSRCIILDFDNTLFDTSADNEYRKNTAKRNWKKIYSLIPKYKLYDGWKDVFEWAKSNKIKIGILSSAQKELIERTLEYHKIPFDAIMGHSNYYTKPNQVLANFLMDKLNVREKQILYVGDSLEDESQARCSRLRFVAAAWDSCDLEALKAKGCECIENPREIIELLKNLG